MRPHGAAHGALARRADHAADESLGDRDRSTDRHGDRDSAGVDAGACALRPDGVLVRAAVVDVDVAEKHANGRTLLNVSAQTHGLSSHAHPGRSPLIEPQRYSNAVR